LVGAHPIDNQVLNYYCSTESQQSQQQIFIGETRSVKPLQGPYLLVNSYIDNNDAAAMIAARAVAAGVEKNCVDYLFSVADFSQTDDSILSARVTFDFDRSELTPHSRDILTELNTLLAGKESKLHLEGNTDAIGSERYNFSLGLKRAQAVEQYLHSNQTHSAVVSYGEQQLLTDEQQRINRRVDIY